MSAITGIYWVILNRAMDPKKRWPTTIPGVILQPKQFSSFNADDPNVTKFPIPDGSPDWDAFMKCQAAVDASIGADPTDGATNYHTFPDGHPLPKWADPDKLTTQIGPVKFYRL